MGLDKITRLTRLLNLYDTVKRFTTETRRFITKSMNVGTQYKLDDEFKAKARLFQSTYRSEVLEVEYQDYGNRLTDSDAEALLNYYSKLNSRDVLRQRYPNYSRKRDADLLRSEHIPFNLLAPLNTDRETAVKIMLANGNTCGIGIEVKYTEQAYPIGKTESVNVHDHNSLYWRTARASGGFKNPDDRAFGSDEFRQIWRNHLLGLRMIQAGDVDEFYSITLFPNGNSHFNHVIPEYISRLQDEAKPYLIGCTFEKFISAIQGTVEFEEWKQWLDQRYIIKDI